MYNNFYTNPYGSYTGVPSGVNPYNIGASPVGSPQGSNTFTGAVVSGYEEVKSYYVPMNGQVLLLDPANSRFYIKKLDSSGVPVVSTFVYGADGVSSQTVQNAPKEVENSTNLVEAYKVLEERVNVLEGLLNKPTGASKRNASNSDKE